MSRTRRLSTILRRVHTARLFPFFVLGGAVLCSGCIQELPPRGQVGAEKKIPSEASPPEAAVVWSGLLTQTYEHLEKDALDEAKRTLAELKELAAAGYTSLKLYTTYPALMVTDTAMFRYPQYHESEDTVDKVDFDRMARVVRGLEKVVSVLVQIDNRKQ